MVRDEFTQRTKDILAKRAGGRCSNPSCRLPTFGPKQGDIGFVNIGDAAHITAAAPGGPRYDPLLTREQRRHPSNGIWLCKAHAHLVDQDSNSFSVETLLTWRNTAEDLAFSDIVQLRVQLDGPISTTLPIPAFVDSTNQLGLSSLDDLESIISCASNAAKIDLANFKRSLRWPDHTIPLSLRMIDGNSVAAFTASGLASALGTFNEIVVVAPPGTGKTTTLIQVVEAVLSQGKLVPVFVPLSEWSSQTDSFLLSTVRRHAYAGMNEGQLKLLAHHGRLTLVMDGWNELDSVAKTRARHGVTALQRDYPDLIVVISTRRQALDVAIAGKVVEIGTLSENQQLEIARALRGPEGEMILDHAWRTAGINELVAIPLYLTTLLAHASGGVLPTTKEEVLRLFVFEQERAQDKKEALQEITSGFHNRMLIALAAEATRAANTTISEANTRAVVRTVQDKLATEGQIQLLSAPQPTAVLDMLVSHHVLIRSGAETKELSFQHQQFQEWYASFEVEELMLAAAKDKNRVREALRADVLNVPVWEEPILFACERASRTGTEGVQAVAAVVLDTLGIDPLLASEMIYRSSTEVWEMIKYKVIAFVQRWHTSGRVDRAVHFMVNTGRSEFATTIWPLISNGNSQIQLVALRAGRRFRPTVLGPKVEERIALLSEVGRKHVVSEIIRHSGMDGIELGARIAKLDNSPAVKIAAIEALLFRRADRIAAEILCKAPDEVWKEVACSGYWEDIDDSDCIARLRHERQNYIKSQTDPLQRARVLLNAGREGSKVDLGAEIATLIESTDFPVKNHETGWMIQEAYRLYPSEVTTAILHRLQAGLDTPYGSKQLLQREGLEIDEGPVVDLVMNPDTPQHIAETAVTIVGAQAIGKLIDELVATHTTILTSGRPVEESMQKRFWRLSDLISNAGSKPFFNAVLSRASTSDPSVIALLAERVMRHHLDRPESRQPLEGPLYEEMVIVVERWGETLLANPSATRSQLADVTCAIERLAARNLFPVLRRMLIEDLARWKTAREKFIAELGHGRPSQSDAQTSWTLQYRRAFFAIGNAQVVELMKTYLPDAGYTGFGEDAAWVLKGIHDRTNNSAKEKGLMRGQDFSEVKRKRAKHLQTTDLESSEFAESIFKTLNDLLRPDASEIEHRHALKLSNVAFRLPYGNKTEIIDKLLHLPRPLSEKQMLLTVLVQAGEIISADMVLDAIKSLLVEAKTKPWLLDNDHWVLKSWLELLPFSDRPSTTLNALELLEPNLRLPWDLRGLLSALGYAPSAESEEVIRLLAQKDSRFLKEHEWFDALDRRGTVSAAHIFLDLICSGTFVDSGEGVDTWSVLQKLAAHIRKYPEFRAEVYQKYESLPPSNSKTIIGRAIAEAADEDGVLVLLHGHGPADIHTAIRNVAVAKRPSPNWAGTEEISSVPLPELRKKLFAIAFNSTDESNIARDCLNIIDELRDDYGPVESEPRHPDIESGLPWPPEAYLNAS